VLLVIFIILYNVTHSNIAREWIAIDKVHSDFHSVGLKVIDAINRNNSIETSNFYSQAEELSIELMALIDKLIIVIAENTESGIEILRVTEE